MCNISITDGHKCSKTKTLQTYTGEEIGRRALFTVLATKHTQHLQSHTSVTCFFVERLDITAQVIQHT